jgi:DNA-binding LacI/PurR family transcriptional regulator
MSKPEARRPPVLADVAQAAGVSVPTVSRVLTGSTPVSERTRSKVREAIDLLGYRPNEAARALVRGRQSIVGVISSNTVRYGYAMAIQGIEEAARAAGYVVAITVLDESDESGVQEAVRLMLGQALAGVIVLDFDTGGSQALTELPNGLPVAAVSSYVDESGIPRALFDDRRGGYEATQYLLGLGHTTVHYVAVPGSGRPSGRLAGWRHALDEAGVDAPEPLETDWSSESGYRAGIELAGRPEVTAILCGNDEIAFGVLKALQVSGRLVPREVSVVGFDDQPHAALWTPSLTTVGQDFVALGREAFSLLLQAAGQLETTASESPELHLVVRESTAPPTPRT